MKFDWSYFVKTLPYVASKLNITLSLTVISACFSLLIGVVFALISYYKVKGLSQLLKVWISFVRGTPVATQLFFFYYGMANISSIILNMSPLCRSPSAARFCQWMKASGKPPCRWGCRACR